MKKILISSLIFFVLYSFKPIENRVLNYEVHSDKCFQGRKEYIQAYILLNSGETVTGTIELLLTQQGFVPFSYNFCIIPPNNGRETLRGTFYSTDRFEPINPNNRLALRNNFTHSIMIRGYVAYVTFQ